MYKNKIIIMHIFIIFFNLFELIKTFDCDLEIQQHFIKKGINCPNGKNICLNDGGCYTCDNTCTWNNKCVSKQKLTIRNCNENDINIIQNKCNDNRNGRYVCIKNGGGCSQNSCFWNISNNCYDKEKDIFNYCYRNPQCIPNCENKECGSNGCNGFCGICDNGKQCQNGTCVNNIPCISNCSNKECGMDNCGNICGQCNENNICLNNKCISIPNPDGKSCKRYDEIFKNICPDAYSWQFDDISSTYNCQNANYLIQFCPNNIKKFKIKNYKIIKINNNHEKNKKIKQQQNERKFTFINKCNQDIWLGVNGKNPSGTQWIVPIEMDGYKLKKNETITFENIPNDWSSVKIWPRTNCRRINNINGIQNKPGIICDTGDCGSEQNEYSLNCPNQTKIKDTNFQENYCCWNGNQNTAPTGGQPTTAVEFTLSGTDKKIDYYDLTGVDGFTIPMSVAQYNGNCKNCDQKLGKLLCGNPSCNFNPTSINQWCPEELQIVDKNNKIVACFSPCQVATKQEQLALLYAKSKKYEKEGKKNSLTNFVNWLDLQRQIIGDVLPKGSNNFYKCNDDNDCKKYDPNSICDLGGRNVIQATNMCIFPGCKNKNDCTSEEIIKTNGSCKGTCYNYHYYPKDASITPYGRSKKIAQLCCDCGCYSTMLNEMEKLSLNGECGNTCCDNGCYSGCTNNTIDIYGAKAECPNIKNVLIDNYRPEQKCTIDKTDFWPPPICVNKYFL